MIRIIVDDTYIRCGGHGFAISRQLANADIKHSVKSNNTIEIEIDPGIRHQDGQFDLRGTGRTEIVVLDLAKDNLGSKVVCYQMSQLAHESQKHLM